MFPSLFCCTQEVQEPIKTLGYKPLQYVSFSDVFGLGALLSVRGVPGNWLGDHFQNLAEFGEFIFR